MRDLFVRGVNYQKIVLIYSPLLIIVVHLLFSSSPSSYAILSSFFFIVAAGHHLPTFIRVYGDKKLWEQNRVILILCPTLIISLCVYYSFQKIQTLQLLLSTWGAIHYGSQIYGLSRILETRSGLSQCRSVGWDRSFLAVGFATGLVLSPGVMGLMLKTFYRAGGPFIPSTFFDSLSVVGLVGFLIVLMLYVGRAVKTRELHQNRHKYLLIIGSVGYWIFCMMTFESVAISVALFEFYHDIQYIYFVWGYNKRLNELNHPFRKSVSHFFTRGRLGMCAFLFSVGLYGSLFGFRQSFPEYMFPVLSGIFMASILYHFLLDGFIWKLGSPTNRLVLELATPERRQRIDLRTGTFFLIALILLLGIPFGTPKPSLEIARQVASAVPQSAKAQLDLGKELLKRGLPYAATRAFERAIIIRSDSIPGYLGLAQSQKKSGNRVASLITLDKLLEFAPDHARAKRLRTNLSHLSGVKSKFESRLLPTS